MGKLKIYNNYEEVQARVNMIKDTENSYFVKNMNSAKRRDLLNFKNYSDYGLTSAGIRLGFPAGWLQKYGEMHPDGAKKILTDVYDDAFKTMELNASDDKRKSKSLFIRDFDNKHCAVLTDRYAVFDDDEVCKILSKSEYLMNASDIWGSISPERFHLRFISPNKLYVNGDDSPLSMCVFIDNSMCGMSSFKIRFGIYRWACTNGMIVGLKEFTLVKEAHKGIKDYATIVNQALENIPRYEEMLLKMVEEAIDAKSKIYELDEEAALAYIQKSLNVSKKASVIIFDKYLEYGGKSKWDLVNAITDYSHAVDINERTQLETKALKVA